MTDASKQGKGSGWTIRPHVKDMAAYLLILVVVSLLLVGSQLNFTDSMLIYAQKDKPDFLQVFFPIDGAYSEENSVRSAPFDNPINGVIIPLPQASIDHVRIDPANEAAEIVITKIELRHMFGTETFMPKDLLDHAKPTQMIDKMEVTPAGLLIRSTGNDPAFELQLDKPRVPYQFIMLCITSISLSLVLYFGITILHARKKQITEKYKSIMPNIVRQNFGALASIVFVWGWVLYAVYPGFMSYDSLHALREARGAVQGGTYPPFVSYAWRVLDFLWPGPTLMIITQNFLLLFSVGVLLKKLNYSDKVIAPLIILIALLPPLLGPMLVAWKDVSVAACFCVSVACIKSSETSFNTRPLIILGVLFLFFAAAFRFNAISGVIPLLLWLSHKRYCERWGATRSYFFSLLIFFMIFVSVNVLNNYRIPSLERLAHNRGFEVIMAYDLIGISVFASKVFVPVNDSKTGKPISIEYLTEIYDPRHINITIDNDRERRLAALISIPGNIVRDSWVFAVRNEPLSYFKHRTEVFSELIGATTKPMFYPTHGMIDKNEYGISQQQNWLTSTVLKYISKSSQTLFGKPWFYYLIGFAAVIMLGTIFKKEIDSSAMFFIFASGIFYILPFFLISPAADLRYNLWAVISMLITLLIAIGPIIKKETTQ